MRDESILVIDDSPTILKVVQLVLTKAGHRVATASGGQAGLLAAKEDVPRLVLLDHQMPDMNGDDVCRAMSADIVLSEVPVVVMGTQDDQATGRFAQLANVVDHIRKPFTPEALLAVIERALGREKNETGTAQAPVAHAAAEEAGEPAAARAPSEPALAGDLAVISLMDVLTLLRDQAQTGLLILTRQSSQVEVSLDGGRIAFATAKGVPEEFLLGRFLVQAGQIEARALAKVLGDRRRAGAHKLLGADLVARGLVTPAGLRQAMATQASSLIFESLRWGAGRFTFYAGAPLAAPAREADLCLSVDPLVMEGLRRVDEWRLLAREVGDVDRVFVRDDERISALGRGQLLREERVVLEQINGRRSVKDIVVLTKMGSFEVTKMLYRLLRSKLVRPRVPPVAA